MVVLATNGKDVWSQIVINKVIKPIQHCGGGGGGGAYIPPNSQ